MAEDKQFLSLHPTSQKKRQCIDTEDDTISSFESVTISNKVQSITNSMALLTDIPLISSQMCETELPTFCFEYTQIEIPIEIQYSHLLLKQHYIWLLQNTNIVLIQDYCLNNG